ncbi:porin [Glaesserella sp.]|uniref:porin n=1 Tax=Glaesserella sp. TaxID=2094731 RepID=UPI0035A067DA
MKKTLIALATAALATTSAQALTVYENEGTTVGFDGSLRLILENAKKEVNGQGNRTHSNLRNADSRFGVRVNHELDSGLYALGRLEFRFDNKDDSTDTSDFGDLYAKRAYVGLGHKQYGEVTFGRQLTIADDIGLTDDYEYGIIPGYTQTDGTSVVRYDYKGIEGLQLGVNYNFAENRDASGEVLVNKIKNGYGVGFVYATDVAPEQKFMIESAYTRNNYATYTNSKHYADGVELGVGYRIGALTLVADLGYGNEKLGGAKARGYFVSPGIQYQVTEASRIYGNYLYEHNKFTGNISNDDSVEGSSFAKVKNATGAAKETSHGGLIGVDYKLHKHAVTFVEAKYVRTKGYNSADNYTGNKVTDKAIGIGMRVYW